MGPSWKTLLVLVIAVSAAPRITLAKSVDSAQVDAEEASADAEASKAVATESKHRAEEEKKKLEKARAEAKEALEKHPEASPSPKSLKAVAAQSGGGKETSAGNGGHAGGSGDHRR